MELEFTDDQAALRDSVREVLAKESPISLAREVAERGTGADRLARVVAELGWAGLTVPVEFGGIGLGPIEAGLLAEELGRAVTPGPLLTTVTHFVPLVRATGSPAAQAAWLGPVAAGTRSGTAAFMSNVRADVVGERVRLTGTAPRVLEANAVDAIALTAATGRGPAIVVVTADQARIEPVRCIDPTRGLANVHFDDVEVSADQLWLPEPAGTEPAVAFAELNAVAALALETVGTCQAIFDQALEYAKQRHQFGVPIGSFQAIKHKFADMIVLLERARATGYLAALCLAEGDERAAITTSAAKAAAGDCQRRLAKEGIQILGGIGYTWEADMHLYVKRAKANDLLGGTAGHHRARIADLLGV